MSVFDRKSRYVRHAAVTHATDRTGRTVACVTPAHPPAKRELGLHRRREGQRLDHFAAHYLGDPAGFWEVAEANDAMTTDAIAEAHLVRIPQKG